MPLPVNVSVCTITGKFVDADGSATEGTVVFIPTPLVILDVAAIPPTTIMGTPIAVDLDVNGAIPVGFTIPATDDPDLSPVDWAYRVIFSSAYYKPEDFYMNAPGGTTVDLTGVLPIPESPGVPGNIPDGSRGDINVSGNGLIWDIAALAVGTPEIAALAVTDVKLAANAVTTAKILDANVTPAKLAASLPRGVVAKAKVTANQTPITTIVDLTGLTVTWTADPSRLYKISFHITVSSSVAADNGRVTITDSPGTTDFGLAGGYLFTTSIALDATTYESGLSGSITRKLRLARISGTGNLTMTASATSPAHILVEDIGIP